MSLFESATVALLIVVLGFLAYVIRSLRIHGTKLSSIQKEMRKNVRDSEIQLSAITSVVQSTQFREIPGKASKKTSWKYVLSFTSHPDRKSTSLNSSHT